MDGGGRRWTEWTEWTEWTSMGANPVAVLFVQIVHQVHRSPPLQVLLDPIQGVGHVYFRQLVITVVPLELSLGTFDVLVV